MITTSFEISKLLNDIGIIYNYSNYWFVNTANPRNQIVEPFVDRCSLRLHYRKLTLKRTNSEIIIYPCFTFDELMTYIPKEFITRINYTKCFVFKFTIISDNYKSCFYNSLNEEEEILISNGKIPCDSLGKMIIELNKKFPEVIQKRLEEFKKDLEKMSV